MFCKYCGADIRENDSFCGNCGADVKAQAYSETQQKTEAYGHNSQDSGAYYGNQQNNGGFYGDNSAANNPSQGYWAPPVNNKAPDIKEYLKWMLLYPLWNLIPGIGFIIYIVFCIKYALDTTYPARANYFKATLVAQVLGVVFAVLMFIVMFVFMGVTATAGYSFLEEMDPSFFMDEFYEAYPALFIR